MSDLLLNFTGLETFMLRKQALVFAALVTLATLSGCAPSQQATAPAQGQQAGPGSAADLAKLQADALSWFDYYAKTDAEGMANLYAEDALLMPPGAGAVTGRPAIKIFLGADAAKSKAAGISIKPGSVTGTGITGDSGWISGNYTAVDASGATIDSGSYLSVHRLTNGAWLYVRDIWNSDRSPVLPTVAVSGTK